MLLKRVPVIVPLHEVANSAATPEQPTEPTPPPAPTTPPSPPPNTAQTLLPPFRPPELKPLPTPSSSPSPSPPPSAKPALPQPSEPPLQTLLPPPQRPPSPPLPELAPSAAPPPRQPVPPSAASMRPLRKNKRLRPALPAAGDGRDDDGGAGGGRRKVSKLNERGATKGAGNGGGRGRRGDRDVSSSASDSRRSTVCSPASSGGGGNREDIATETLLKFAGVAKQQKIVWTKIKGHPYWPTQHVRMDAALEGQERFRNATRFRRKGDDTCVMYFGTCEVAYVNAEKACIAWDEGLKRNMHMSHRSRTVFQRALAEVKAFCHRNTRYPRGWWCEPRVMVLAAELYDLCVTDGIKTRLREQIARADVELIFWAKMRGFPQWPVQVLPRNVAREKYPQLKMTSENPAMPSMSVPCIFFGTSEVAMVLGTQLAPFGAGLIRGYVAASDRHDFTVATGEVWGYLQTPRIWPSGFLSGALWWNYEETRDAESEPGADAMDVRVPHMPVYDHIRKSVWADGVEVPTNPKKFEFSCCGCTSNGRDMCCADSNCLNFASRFLCNPATCLAGPMCKNLLFHRRKSPKMKPFFTADQRGWGLRAMEAVKSGSFVIEYVGEIINRDMLDRRLKTTQQQGSSEYYMMDLTNDLLVDAKFKGNLSRFINSSCEPNCQTQKWIDCSTGQTHVGIFAIQDIPEGTELTYNYCFEDYGLSGKSQKRSFMCQCGTSSCSMLEPIEKKLMRKLIGKRLEVRWDDGWYPGVVELYNLKDKRFRVQYDDGDCEDLVLGLPLADDDGIAFRLVEDKPSGVDSSERASQVTEI